MEGADKSTELWRHTKFPKILHQRLAATLVGEDAVWSDWAIFCTLGKCLKPLAAINFPKSPTFLGNFVKVSKSILFLVKSFLGNFYRHSVIFFWSHCILPSVWAFILPRKWYYKNHFWRSLFLPLLHLLFLNNVWPITTCGQSYKASTIVIYDSRVVPDLKIPHITTLES